MGLWPVGRSKSAEIALGALYRQQDCQRYEKAGCAADKIGIARFCGIERRVTLARTRLLSLGTATKIAGGTGALGPRQ